MVSKLVLSISLFFIAAQSVASIAIPVRIAVASCASGSGMSSPSSPCADCTPASYSLGGFNAVCLPCGTGVSVCNAKTGIITSCTSAYNLKLGICVVIAPVIIKPLGTPSKVIAIF